MHGVTRQPPHLTSKTSNFNSDNALYQGLHSMKAGFGYKQSREAPESSPMGKQNQPNRYASEADQGSDEDSKGDQYVETSPDKTLPQTS